MTDSLTDPFAETAECDFPPTGGQPCQWRLGCALLALFVLVCGARLWLVDFCGASVPFWDQWDAEGDALFAPLLQGPLPLSRLFEPHMEHRIVLTRLLALGLFELDGMWDPRLEMVVNAGIAAGTAAIVAGLLLREIGRRWWRPVACVVAILWALPFAWHNTIMGLASHFYLMLLFSFLTIWGLCYGRPYTIAWWTGAVSAILSCLTMASGFLAPLGVLLVLAAAVVLERKTWRMHLPGLVLCLLCVAVSVGLQSGAFAYGRGRFGVAVGSRYQDVLAIGPLVAFVALLLESGSMRRRVWYAGLAGWFVFTLLGFRENFRDFRKALPHQYHCAAEQARRCRAYVETRDIEVLRHTADRMEIPYPKPESLARLLDDPHIRSALLFVPGQEDKAAWPTHLARALLRASRWIFLLGLLGLIAALWPARASNRGASSRIGDQTGPV